jgi:hypothetical protein
MSIQRCSCCAVSPLCACSFFVCMQFLLVCAPVVTHSSTFCHALTTRQVSVWPKNLSCFPCLHLLDVEPIYALSECSTTDCKTVYASCASLRPNMWFRSAV